jgi:DNA-binding CsgD family transcriptional regulator
MHEDIARSPNAILPQQNAAQADARPLPSALGDALMLRLIDEIDYGLMLVDAGGRVRVANRLARRECAAPGALRVVHGELQAAQPADSAALRHALDAAQRGRRELLELGRGGQRVRLAVVPLSDPGDDGAHALIVFGKRQLCETLSVELFARAHGLTSAEAKVLQALCGGAQPTGMARQFGVAISTIRTQLASLRQKTEAASIRDIVQQIAELPPVVSALRAEPFTSWH